MTVAVEAGTARRVDVRSEGPGPSILLGGRFRLDERIAAAGALSLWKATDALLCRPVSIHLLPLGVPVPAPVVEAVQAAARVNDPRLATIYDTNYSTDGPYIVSEWTPGTHLEDLVLSGLPSPALAAAMIADAADALAVAHQAGRPHLCLSPRSLRWDTGSGLKITGLGIDAALSGATAADPATADTIALGCCTPCSPATGPATSRPRCRPPRGTRDASTPRGRSGPGCRASWTRSPATPCNCTGRAPHRQRTGSPRPGWPRRCARCCSPRTRRSARPNRPAALRIRLRTRGPDGRPGICGPGSGTARRCCARRPENRLPGSEERADPVLAQDQQQRGYPRAGVPADQQFVQQDEPGPLPLL